jgi:hypothetical protein
VDYFHVCDQTACGEDTEGSVTVMSMNVNAVVGVLRDCASRTSTLIALRRSLVVEPAPDQTDHPATRATVASPSRIRYQW